MLWFISVDDAEQLSITTPGAFNADGRSSSLTAPNEQQTATTVQVVRVARQFELLCLVV
jgi:hypothetical protein